jgi:hypothetical protein
MAIRTEELLKDYRKGAEKIARVAYLQAIALKKEIFNNGLNPEDQQAILIHCIGLLATTEQKGGPNAQKGTKES